ncbi:MAG TPA: hypothetical protein VNN19_02635 [bacterium]|nr:hypothetical protein [bacterium]
MAETTGGPGGVLIYGTAVRGEDIEKRSGLDPASWLTRLFRSILMAAIAKDGLHYLVPEVTDKVTTPDGGVDASLSVELNISEPRQPGLVNPGKTIYQIKWRSEPNAIVSAAHGELAKVLAKSGTPDVYVFVTNVVLTKKKKAAILDALVGGTEFPQDRVVVLGGSELADRVNDDPRIRVAYFGVSVGLTTLDQAIAHTERRYRREGDRPALFNRADQIGTIKRFLEGDQKVMIVHGPASVGKSRVVQESLSEIPERIIWARGVPPQVSGLLQVVDESPGPAILVIDDANEGAEAAVRVAQEAKQVKTILLVDYPLRAPGAERLQVDPFDQESAEKFLAESFPSIPFIHRRWLFDQFGGAPGLLVQAGAALTSVIDRDPLRVPAYEALMDEYERRMTRGLGDAVRTLQAFSILSRFSVGPTAAPDLEAICSRIGLTRARALQDIDLLRAIGLVEEADWPGDGVFRVIPPLLARRVARRVLQGLADDLPELFASLSTEARAALVRRVGECREAGGPLDRFLGWIMEASGLFSDIGSVSIGASVVRALAETMPHWVVRILRRVVEATEVDELRTGLAGESRRQVVRALESLLRNRDTFEDAARILLRLGEAENETWANNARAIFVEGFNWRHPEIPADARLRARLLASLAGEPVSERRVLVAEAAAHALETQFIVMRLSEERPVLPEVGWPSAATWDEVRDALHRTAEVLLRLAVDPEQRVRDAAIRGFARGINGLLSAGLLDEAVTGLESLQRVALEGRQRSDVVGAVARLVSILRKTIAANPARSDRQDLESAIRRAEELFVRLTEGDFRARFQHWLGPSPIAARRQIGDEEAEYEEIREQALQLAAEVTRNPGLLEGDLCEWVIGEHAYSGGYFLFSLGKVDRERRLLPVWEARVEERRGLLALALYVAGWIEAEPVPAGLYLDALVTRGGVWAQAAVEATLRSGLKPEGVERLLRCVTTGMVDRLSLSRSLAIARWGIGLPVESFRTLVEGLRDGSTAVDWGLLESLHAWIEQEPEKWDVLAPLVMELLRNTASGRPAGQWGYRWDGLAATVAQRDPERGFALLLAHLDSEGQDSVFVTHDRARLLAVLSSIDRRRLVRTLLNAARSHAQGWKLHIELPQLINIETDGPELLEFVEREGVEGARLLARHLDGGSAGFWTFAAQLLERWGNDEEVREGILLSAITIRHAYSDEADELRPRLAPTISMVGHPDPYVTDTARRARDALERIINRE